MSSWLGWLLGKADKDEGGGDAARRRSSAMNSDEDARSAMYSDEDARSAMNSDEDAGTAADGGGGGDAAIISFATMPEKDLSDDDSDDIVESALVAAATPVLVEEGTSHHPHSLPSMEGEGDNVNEPSLSSRRGRRTTTRQKVGCAVGITSLLIFAIIMIAVSLKRLSSTEIGVEYNIHSKKLNDAIKSGGLHAGPPGFEFIKFPSTFITDDLPPGTCVSREGLRVEFLVTYQYQMPAEWLKPAVLKYRNFENWADIVSAAAQSAVQHSCAAFEISNFSNQRGRIQDTMLQNLRLKLEGTASSKEHNGVHARAVSLQLRNVELPQDYKSTVRAKQAAVEDIALAQNQRQQEETKARTSLLAAQEEARKILDTANANVNITLTKAELEAQETLFKFQTEADIIRQAQATLDLTTAGILSYLSNQLLGEAKNLHVSTQEPARLTRKDEL